MLSPFFPTLEFLLLSECVGDHRYWRFCMRTTPILIVTAIAVASTGAAYYFLRDNALPRQVEAAKPSISSTANLNVKNTPMREERRDQPATPEQQRLTLMNE